MGDNNTREADAEILHRLQMGRIDALEQLTEQYGQVLTRAAYAYLHDADTAQDVVQDTLIAAWDGASRTRPETSLRPWLFGILFNLCRKHRRSASRRLRRERASSRQMADVRRGTKDRQQYDAMYQAIQRLDDKHLAVVVLRYERGLSVAETAEALQLPEGTVKSRTFAALERIRSYIRQDNEPD